MFRSNGIWSRCFKYSKRSKGSLLGSSGGLASASTSGVAFAKLVCFAELPITPFWPQKPATTEPLACAEQIPGSVADALCAVARETGAVLVTNLYSFMLTA